MLTLNPKKRISAQAALSDPWIANNNIGTALNKHIIENLTNFQSQSRFRHAIMTYMASLYMTKNEEKEMLSAFQALDLDGNGVLTVEELMLGIISLNQATKRCIPRCPWMKWSN